jgi:hypothetical protein
VPARQVELRVRLIGFGPTSRTVVVAAGQITRADFALQVSALQLEQVVVTGTGQQVEVKKLGNTVATVTPPENAPIKNMSELIQGHLPARHEEAWDRELLLEDLQAIYPVSEETKGLIENSHTAEEIEAAVLDDADDRSSGVFAVPAARKQRDRANEAQACRGQRRARVCRRTETGSARCHVTALTFVG